MYNRNDWYDPDDMFGPNGSMNDRNRQISPSERTVLDSNQLTEIELDNMTRLIWSRDFNIRDVERLHRELLPNHEFDPYWSVFIPLHPVNAMDTDADLWRYRKGSYQAKLLTMIEYIRSSRIHSGKRKVKRNSRKRNRNSRKHF